MRFTVGFCMFQVISCSNSAVLFFVVVLFSRQVFLLSPVCPATCSVKQTSLKLWFTRLCFRNAGIKVMCYHVQLQDLFQDLFLMARYLCSFLQDFYFCVVCSFLTPVFFFFSPSSFPPEHEMTHLGACFAPSVLKQILLRKYPPSSRSNLRKQCFIWQSSEFI